MGEIRVLCIKRPEANNYDAYYSFSEFDKLMYRLYNAPVGDKIVIEVKTVTNEFLETIVQVDGTKFWDELFEV